MRTVRLEYGDGHVDADLPDDAVVVAAGAAQSEPTPLTDPLATTRAAVRSPLGCVPIPELVGAGATVTIAFPDRVKGGSQETAHRRVSLHVLREQLRVAGVHDGDVRLVCAIGLHRKNTRAEFDGYLGVDNLAGLANGQIDNHDAEDPDGIVDLGMSALGDVVQVNRHVLESDLTILIGHTAGNPYGGFSGGYKMPATGLTTWQSIRCHHTPQTMHRGDFVPVSAHSRFRDQLRAIGQAMEAAMPRPFFSIDAVLDARSRQLGVAAGAIPDVERATWPLASLRTELVLDGPPADVLVVGMPRTFHYGPGMGSNPILMMQAIGSSIVRAKRALRPRPVVIAASVCDGWFNDTEFAATQDVYRALQDVDNAADLVRFEDEISGNADHVDRYRRRHAYHPFHAFSMAYMGGVAHNTAAAVFIAGAAEPRFASGMGAIPASSVEAALAAAADYVGNRPRVLVVPELSKPAYHLSVGGVDIRRGGGVH